MFESICCSEHLSSDTMSSVAVSSVSIALHEREDGRMTSANKQHQRAISISASLRNGYLLFQKPVEIDSESQY
jgi:hypothetical protein